MTETIVDVRRKDGCIFSFGRRYDPDNTHFGLLLVSNDDVVAPNTGFSTHPHRDMEIVTWVLAGELVRPSYEQLDIFTELDGGGLVPGAALGDALVLTG